MPVYYHVHTLPHGATLYTPHARCLHIYCYIPLCPTHAFPSGPGDFVRVPHALHRTHHIATRTPPRVPHRAFTAHRACTHCSNTHHGMHTRLLPFTHLVYCAHTRFTGPIATTQHLPRLIYLPLHTAPYPHATHFALFATLPAAFCRYHAHTRTRTLYHHVYFTLLPRGGVRGFVIS